MTDAVATKREELLTLRNTMLGMIERLVSEGVLTLEEAQVMIDQAEVEAQQEATQLADQAGIEPDAVRVTYVPDIVRDEIREQVMTDLRDEVVEEVLEEAQRDQWGVPGALPAWLSDLRFSADLRLRGQTDLFADGNAVGVYPNIQAINEAGGPGFAAQNGLLNTTEDRERLRARMRLGVDLRMSNNWYGGLRLTTTNEGNPVSRNQTLGQGNPSLEAVVDLAYLHYRSKHFLFSGGRIPNPFVHTDLIYDPDLTFEGLTFTGVLPFNVSGVESRAFLTAGAFPLQEVELSSDDKWFYGGQLGLRFGFGGGGQLTLASSYYLFDNVVGQRNTPESQLLDYTAPEFVQKGNTYFDIRNENTPSAETALFALASEFELLNGTILLDSGPIFRTGSGRPIHLSLSGDYVKNIGWDEDEILERTQLLALDERTEGYKATFGIGSPRVSERGDWRFEAMFKHLQRDAVLDAFTESNFHLGGTDAEGWGAMMQYGLSRNTWVELEYMTASEIDGPPLGIDVFQLDINAKF